MSKQAQPKYSKRTYENAIRLLETRRRKTRPTYVPPTISAPHHGTHATNENVPTYRGIPSILGMRDWLQKLGHSKSDITSLNVIHVAGTKGKGSTCAFTRSFLQQWSKKTGFPNKIGLYTSPDLTCIRERIQIDSIPVSEELFVRYFFEVWDRLFASDHDQAFEERKPRFLQLIALLAFHIFAREGVQATIFETHHGGEYDATNVITRPVVVGITSIGIDHILQLGPTIEDIAWHKAGIFKVNRPAFSAPQVDSVATVLCARAIEKTVPLQFVSEDTSLVSVSNKPFVDVQRINCSLAIALTNAFLLEMNPSRHERLSEEDIKEGIQSFSWPGRFEIICTNKCKWFLDGAHNDLSIGQAVQWFSEAIKNSAHDLQRERRACAVIFSHLSNARDGIELLGAFAKALEVNSLQPDHVIFTTYQERRDGRTRLDKMLKVPDEAHADLLKRYYAIWKTKNRSADVQYKSSIEDALDYVQNLANDTDSVQTLVTGSLHLVGGALHLLRESLEDEIVSERCSTERETPVV